VLKQNFCQSQKDADYIIMSLSSSGALSLFRLDVINNKQWLSGLFVELLSPFPSKLVRVN